MNPLFKDLLKKADKSYNTDEKDVELIVNKHDYAQAYCWSWNDLWFNFGVTLEALKMLATVETQDKGEEMHIVCHAVPFIDAYYDARENILNVMHKYNATLSTDDGYVWLPFNERDYIITLLKRKTMDAIHECRADEVDKTELLVSYLVRMMRSMQPMDTEVADTCALEWEQVKKDLVERKDD